MYQRIVIVGHLGSDPEMRYTPNATPWTNFRVATNRRWTDAEGKPHEETTWFRVVSWGKLAETCNQFLAKGRLVLVDGEMQERTWEDKEGQSRRTWELRARTVKFLGGREGKAEEAGAAEEAPEEEVPF